MLCSNCKVEMKKIKTNYRYTECGLKNVVLRGIPAYKCPKCKEINPIIPRIKEIHKIIGEDLINKNSLLMGNEVTFLRKEMGIRAKDLAQILGVTKVTVSRWENEREQISPACDRLIRLLYGNRIFEQTCRVVRPEIGKLQSQIVKAILTSVCEPKTSIIEEVFRNIRRRHIHSEILIPNTRIASSKPIQASIFPIPNLNLLEFK
jgi:putative zinc finger/helix-turn-helix YgiT family protein